MSFSSPDLSTPLFTPRDVARLLRIKLSTVYAWTARGQLPGMRVNGCIRFDAKSLNDFLTNSATVGGRMRKGSL